MLQSLRWNKVKHAITNISHHPGLCPPPHNKKSCMSDIPYFCNPGTLQWLSQLSCLFAALQRLRSKEQEANVFLVFVPPCKPLASPSRGGRWSERRRMHHASKWEVKVQQTWASVIFYSEQPGTCTLTPHPASVHCLCCKHVTAAPV